MMLTAETLTRHELIGLHLRVVEASNPTLVGIEGKVVMETTNTLSVAVADDTDGDRAGEESQLVRVPKADATFEFRLPGDDADGSGHDAATDAGVDPAPDSDPEYVVVDGEVLVARPARRTERTGDSRWQ